jgi:hypothetical protein
MRPPPVASCRRRTFQTSFSSRLPSEEIHARSFQVRAFSILEGSFQKPFGMAPPIRAIIFCNLPIFFIMSCI